MKKTLQLSVILASSALLFACSNKPAVMNDQASACADNPFLQKYNCDITQVQQAAEQGNADAEYALGYMYYYGVDTTQDTQTALIWIKRSAEQGQPLAVKALKMLDPNAKIHQHHEAKVRHLSQSSGSASSKAMVSAPLMGKIATIPSSHYTIQVLASFDRGRVSHFVREHGLQKHAAMYQSTYKGKPWTVLIYGDYASKAAAEKAKRNLPMFLQHQHPWVKSFAAVKKEMK